NILKWAPEAVALPIPAGKCPPLGRRRAVRFLRLRFLAGSNLDTLQTSLQNGRLHGPLCRALLAIAEPKPISSTKGHPQRAHKARSRYQRLTTTDRRIVRPFEQGQIVFFASKRQWRFGSFR